MSWDRPRPSLNDNESDERLRDQEVYDRFKAFGTVSVGDIAVAANDTTDTVVNLTSGSGVRTGMGVVMNPPDTLPAGIVVGSVRATATDTIQLRLGNCSAAPQTVPGGAWTFWGIIV